MRDAVFSRIGFLLAVLWGAGAAIADEPAASSWSVFANSRFEVYSDAPQDQVMLLAEDLERFRAALVRLGFADVPDGAPPTRVIILQSRDDHPGVFVDDAIEAFTTGIDDAPYIVMAADKTSDWAQATIRHEYVHVLQGYAMTDLPPWYVEGTAEFLSGMTIGENDQLVSWDKPVRRPWTRRLMVPWDALVADDFRFDALDSATQASTAYYQAGLLVRYLGYGDDVAYSSRLDEYLDRVASGERSADIFAPVFGVSATEIGSRAYADRKRKIGVPATQTSAASREEPIYRSAVAPGVVAEWLAHLQSRNSARPIDETPK